jgi:hypothetical protein
MFTWGLVYIERLSLVNRDFVRRNLDIYEDIKGLSEDGKEALLDDWEKEL